MRTTPAAPKQDDTAQSKRFVDMARELGPDESGEKFDRAFQKITRGPREPITPKPKERPASKGRVHKG
jgi:hypothetical protein